MWLKVAYTGMVRRSFGWAVVSSCDICFKKNYFPSWPLANFTCMYPRLLFFIFYPMNILMLRNSEVGKSRKCGHQNSIGRGNINAQPTTEFSDNHFIQVTPAFSRHSQGVYLFYPFLIFFFASLNPLIVWLYLFFIPSRKYLT